MKLLITFQIVSSHWNWHASDSHQPESQLHHHINIIIITITGALQSMQFSIRSAGFFNCVYFFRWIFRSIGYEIDSCLFFIILIACFFSIHNRNVVHMPKQLWMHTLFADYLLTIGKMQHSIHIFWLKDEMIGWLVFSSANLWNLSEFLKISVIFYVFWCIQWF